MKHTELYQDRRKREEAEAKAKQEAAEALFWPKLEEALVAKGHTVEWRDATIFGKKTGKRVIHKIDDSRVTTFHVTAERSKLRIGETASGKIKFVIGDYGNKKQFFQSQSRAGGFDFDAIVAEIERRIAWGKANAEKRERDGQTILEARQMRERLVREFFENPGTTKEWSTGDPQEEATEFLTVPEDSPLTLKETTEGGLLFSIEVPIADEEKLRELLATCKKIGLCG